VATGEFVRLPSQPRTALEDYDSSSSSENEDNISQNVSRLTDVSNTTSRSSTPQALTQSSTNSNQRSASSLPTSLRPPLPKKKPRTGMEQIADSINNYASARNNNTVVSAFTRAARRFDLLYQNGGLSHMDPRTRMYLKTRFLAKDSNAELFLELQDDECLIFLDEAEKDL